MLNLLKRILAFFRRKEKPLEEPSTETFERFRPPTQRVRPPKPPTIPKKFLKQTPFSKRLWWNPKHPKEVVERG